MEIYDISTPIRNSMPIWPGDTPVELQQVSSINNGENTNVTQIQMSVHTGTHIDAPRHFINAGKSVDEIPLSKLVGSAFLMEIDQEVDLITAGILESHPHRDMLENHKKVLFKTRNSSEPIKNPNNFYEDYVGIDSSAASYLSQLKLDLVGMDYFSIASFEDLLQPHLILLKNEIVLLEGIQLEHIPEGIYRLYCLPLLIPGCDGAPARAILIKE